MKSTRIGPEYGRQATSPSDAGRIALLVSLTSPTDRDEHPRILSSRTATGTAPGRAERPSRGNGEVAGRDWLNLGGVKPNPHPHRVGALAALLVATVMLVTGCAFGPPEDSDTGTPPRFPTPSTTPSQDGGGAAAQVIVKDLEVPWGLAFLPDGTALVTERDSGRILKVGKDMKVSEAQTVRQAQARGEGGLMGIAVSPRFAEDQTVFIYYTTETDNRIAKLRLGQQPQPIVTGIPASTIHNGGRLAFGPDGYLYAATGDGSQRALAQDRRSLAGKILRMTVDGKPAPGNPFGNSLVYSLGHRNVQGLAWDGQKRLYASEFGQDRWDELNLIEPGKNYGWPQVEGVAQNSAFVNPIAVWPPADASPSGIAVAGDVLATAALRGQRLWLVQLNGRGGTLGAPSEALTGKFGRLRTIVTAPDGSLWLTTSNRDGRGEPAPTDDRIIRIVISGSDGVGKS